MSLSAGEEANAKANGHYRRGDFTAAIEHYSVAIDSAVGPEHAPALSKYHANRAQAYVSLLACVRMIPMHVTPDVTLL
jgi:hypothetical protein